MKRTALALTAILALLIPSMANAQITSSYSNNTNINPVAFTLTIHSPDNNQTYTSLMLLNFTIDWTKYPTFTFPSPPAPIMKGDYSYTIDNNTAVTVTSNQSSTDSLDPKGFKVNPTFSYLLNVSLANGYHKIVITADLRDNNGIQYFKASSDPVFFSIQNPTPTPTPLPTLNVETIALLSVIIGVAVLVGLLVYFKKRKH
jgi:hypothetical protein